MRHIYKLNSPPEKTPNKYMPDGAITGNGDLAVVWGGKTDRVQLYIGRRTSGKPIP